MKKRLAIFALAICLILPCLFMLTACDDKAPHVHNFSEEWSTNATHHWYACDGCNEQKDKVEHTFNQEVVDAQYLKSVANCVSPAVYFKSCICGEKGTETFETGGVNAENHSFGSISYVWNGNISCTATRVCTNCEHPETETVNSQSQITQEQSCVDDELTTYTVTFTNRLFEQQTKENVHTKPALGHDFANGAYITTDSNYHWKKCLHCDAEDVTNKVAHDFTGAWVTDGTHHWKECEICGKIQEKIAHTFNQEVVDAQYLKSVANCVSPAVYFKSCVCGEKGTETFETGGIDSQVHDFEGGVYITTDSNYHWKKCSRCDAEDLTNKVAHSFDQQVQDEQYLIVAATCENKGEYYYSCSCGKRGETTFETAVSAHSYVDGACSHCGATEGLVYSGGSVTGYTGTATNVVIPKHNNSGAVIKEISSNAFKDNTNIVRVTLPDSVQYIRANAFKGCTNLQTINLEDVSEFSSGAFENCSSLNGISLDSATVLGQSLFKNCTSLESVVFPNQLTNIQMNGFYGCSSLASITFGAGLQQIDAYAFQYCTALTSVNLPNNITLEYKSFGNCSNLTTANIPTGITEIGNFFRDCTSLNNITIPAGVTTIGYEAFYGCSNLSDITFEEGSQLETIGDTAFALTALTSITLPNTVTSVGYRAFHMCDDLRNVNFGTGLQTLGYEVLYNVNLTEVTLPATLTSIPTVFMVSNSSLTTINYLGTQAQWNALEKGARWVSSLANYVVKTSDNQEGFTEGDYVNVFFYVGNGDKYYDRAVISGTTVSAPTTAPTKEGFTFEGWFKATDYTGSSLSEDAFDFATPITNDTYLFAKWAVVA